MLGRQINFCQLYLWLGHITCDDLIEPSSLDWPEPTGRDWIEVEINWSEIEIQFNWNKMWWLIFDGTIKCGLTRADRQRLDWIVKWPAGKIDLAAREAFAEPTIFNYHTHCPVYHSYVWSVCDWIESDQQEKLTWHFEIGYWLEGSPTTRSP